MNENYPDITLEEVKRGLTSNPVRKQNFVARFLDAITFPAEVFLHRKIGHLYLSVDRIMLPIVTLVPLALVFFICVAIPLTVFGLISLIQRDSAYMSISGIGNEFLEGYLALASSMAIFFAPYPIAALIASILHIRGQLRPDKNRNPFSAGEPIKLFDKAHAKAFAKYGFRFDRVKIILEPLFLLIAGSMTVVFLPYSVIAAPFLALKALRDNAERNRPEDLRVAGQFEAEILELRDSGTKTQKESVFLPVEHPRASLPESERHPE